MRHFAHLDCNVTTACNYSCASCSHLAPFTKAEWMDTPTLRRDLRALKPFMHFDRIQAVGGEPTLSRELIPMLWTMHESGIADQVVVITNGSRLPKMEEQFWKNIDVLKLSVYAKLPPELVEFAQIQCEQYSVKFEQQSYPEFYKQFTREKTDGVESYRDCHWKHDCHSVHFGKYYRCPQSIFFHKLFPTLKAGEDGLDLADLTEEKLSAFLERTEPLRSCSHCSGGHSATIPWHEAKTKEEWIEQATI